MTPELAVGAFLVIAAVSVATALLAVVLPQPRRQVRRDRALARILNFARGGER